MAYQPVFELTPHLLNLIDEISALRASIEKSSIKVPWLPLLQKQARARATRSSTSIEGNPLTLDQVEAIDNGGNAGALKHYELEVSNYLSAMRWIEKHNRLNLTGPKILALHKILTNGLLSKKDCGKYKNRQNYVVNEKGIRIFTPPPPKVTPKLMEELIAWLNSRQAKKLHPILVCAIFHHRLVSIHPFIDGNGRIARALSTWILYQRGFDTNHIFSLEDYFAQDRGRYYQKIELTRRGGQARDLDNNLRCWIEYVAEGIKQTLQDVIKRIEVLQVSSRSKIILSPRQEELLLILKDHSPARVAELEKRLKLTRARINQIITPLIQNGIVARAGIGKASRYSLKISG